VTLAYLESVKAKGLKPGIYAAWNWDAKLFGGGAQFADWLSAELKRIGPGTPKDFPKVCVDIETHDVGYMLAFFKRWRELRPARLTDFTLEGFQGGLFSLDDVQAILHAHVGIVPQFYRGNMEPHEHGVTQEMLMAGFPGSVLRGFYDAAALPYRWDGYAYTQGRLP
jgi:hypothetical protein